MRGFRDAIVVCNCGGSAQHHVAEPGFANVGAAVVGREALDQALGEVNLPVHENVLRWHVDILENCHGLLSAELRIALVDVAGLHGPQVAALTPIDVRDARSIHWYRAGHGIVLVSSFHLTPGHEDHPMGVEVPCLVGFAATQDNTAVGPPLCDAHEEVGVLLLRGIQAAIAFYISHRATQDPVLALCHLHEVLEALVVVRAELLIDVVRRGPHGI
mmetsp:Transcript_59919/g.140166  ORF Transcript_59919/g.140166 Transcript_59919/m.140166 type:complete len:216 (+) Transcript_59919:506-1153(+)